MYGADGDRRHAAHVGGLPALPFLSVGFLAPNADLLWRRLRRPGSHLADGGVTFFGAFRPGAVLIAVSPIVNGER